MTTWSLIWVWHRDGWDFMGRRKVSKDWRDESSGTFIHSFDWLVGWLMDWLLLVSELINQVKVLDLNFFAKLSLCSSFPYWTTLKGSWSPATPSLCVHSRRQSPTLNQTLFSHWPKREALTSATCKRDWVSVWCSCLISRNFFYFYFLLPAADSFPTSMNLLWTLSSRVKIRHP